MHTWKYGIEMRDITPTRSVMQHGYSARTHRSNGVAEPLRLGAIVISDGTTDVLFISVDIVGIHSTDVDNLTRRIEQATGIRSEHIIVSASHTHFAPQISTGMFTSSDIGFFRPEPSDIKRITDAAISASIEAADSLRDSVLESARIAIPGVGFNRRTVRPDGKVDTNYRYPVEGDYTFSPIDDKLTALRFRTVDGTGAVIVNYGCHPVTGGYDPEGDHYKVSSDYIHYVRQTIEEAWGYPTFFTLGAAGDVVPRDRYGESRQRIGAVLGNSVVLADRMFTPVEGDIAVRKLSVCAKTIVEHEPDEAKARYDRAGKTHGEKPDEDFDDALRARFRSDLYPDNRFDIPLTLMRIGTLKIAALPFEVLSEFSTRMKQEYDQSMLISCANGYQGYLPFEYEYERGGYEASASSTHFVPGTADVLYKRVIDELGTL